MSSYRVHVFTVILGFVLAVPQATFAWFTTGQNAVRIDEQTILYTVTYKFGTHKYDLQMPVGAQRNGQVGDSPAYLGYTILKDNETQFDGGQSQGIVLSNAKIIDGRYFVPRGTSAEFTLVTLLKVAPSTPGTYREFDLALQITSLPFTMLSDGAEIAGKLNPSELQYYITPEVDIK